MLFKTSSLACNFAKRDLDLLTSARSSQSEFYFLSLSTTKKSFLLVQCISGGIRVQIEQNKDRSISEIFY